MTVLAELVGHLFDLDALARQFPTGDPRVVVDGDGTFLATDDLDEVFTQAGRMVKIANEHLARLNGWATLADASYRPVRLGSQFHREPAAGVKHVLVSDEARTRGSVTVVQVGTAEARGTAFGVAVVTGGDPVQPPRPAGPRVLARRNPDVDDLLAVVGKAERLSWPELYKVFEIIRDAVGGSRERLVATGWTTKADLSAFTGSVDHRAVSGFHEGRHARSSGRATQAHHDTE
jgi:hypothetical protein